MSSGATQATKGKRKMILIRIRNYETVIIKLNLQISSKRPELGRHASQNAARSIRCAVNPVDLYDPIGKLRQSRMGRACGAVSVVQVGLDAAAYALQQRDMAKIAPSLTAELPPDSISFSIDGRYAMFS